MIIGHDRLFSLLKECQLLVPIKHAYHKTTLNHHRFHRHPNLIKSRFTPILEMEYLLVKPNDLEQESELRNQYNFIMKDDLIYH